MQRPTPPDSRPIPPPEPDDGRIVGIRWRALHKDWYTPADCLACGEHLDVSGEHLRVVMRIEADVAGTPAPWYPTLLFHDGACLGKWARGEERV